jgi:CheY-like chemotaxis protein
MPKKAGIEVVIELRPQKPGPGIIVLTHSSEEKNLGRALAAGAKGVEKCSAGHAGSASPTFAVWRSHLHRGGSSIFGKGID